MRVRRSLLRGCLASAWLVIAGGPLAAETPLSIIDWLQIEEVLATPDDPPVTETALQPQVEVETLGTPDLPIGLVPSSSSGLPSDLWIRSNPTTLIRLIETAPVAGHPALQSLLFSLLLTEAQGDEALLLARVDRLLDLGAVDPAKALLEAADPTSDAALFARWADTAFLTGHEDRICRALEEAPHLSPNPETLIFCVARRGDLIRASLLFDAHLALDDLAPTVAPALDRFLHPELFEDAAPLPTPRAPSPLTFRLYEAIGERLPTASLPRPFAVPDLRDVAGWKAQLEAAERLARTGAISSNTLLGLYTERLPAASGGVWDRVAAVQRLETAISTGSVDAVSKTLPNAWSQMRSVGLEVALADLFAANLIKLPLPPDATGALALDMALLTPDYETLTRGQKAITSTQVLWLALASGDPTSIPAGSPMERAIIAGFGSPATLPRTFRADQLGETILRAMALFDRGADGNLNSLTEAITILRAVGLDGVARSAALHLLIIGTG